MIIMCDDFGCLDGYRRIMFKSELRLASLLTYMLNTAYLCIWLASHKGYNIAMPFSVTP